MSFAINGFVRSISDAIVLMLPIFLQMFPSMSQSSKDSKHEKVACITIKRDQRRSSIFEAAPIKLNLFTRGSSILSFAYNPSSLMEEEEEKVSKGISFFFIGCLYTSFEKSCVT